MTPIPDDSLTHLLHLIHDAARRSRPDLGLPVGDPVWMADMRADVRDWVAHVVPGTTTLPVYADNHD